MKTAHLIFPHQLFKEHPLISADADCWLIECALFFTQYKFHQRKIAFHRASMQAFAEQIKTQVNSLTYIEAVEPYAEISSLLGELAQQGISQVKYIDPTDDWLEQQLTKACETYNLKRKVEPSPLFLTDRQTLKGFFRSNKKQFMHHAFYQQQRRRFEVLLDDKQQPVGGQWSFDADNRKKYPQNQTPPSLKPPNQNTYHQAANKYVEQHFSHHLGSTTANYGHEITYPVTHHAAELWLDDFLHQRFHDFGAYEDAILQNHLTLHHSVLTPMLNVGLLTPQLIVDKTLKFVQVHDIPLNSLEGFIRQVIGWREYMRGLYEAIGRQQRSRNFWQFKRPIPDSFYTATTGIEPVDNTIKKVLDTGYCHHIERLMILGNFMLLCEFDPDHVYQWFMELFIDAYDWVMVPNVYGMSQFADGGLMSSKPYISSSNYILKMSDYQGGKQAAAWRATWDGLFWRFMHQQRGFFESNPRLGMLLKTWDRFDQAQQDQHLNAAESFLAKL